MTFEERRLTDIELLLRKSNPRVQAQGVRGRRIDDTHWAAVEMSGIPVVPPALLLALRARESSLTSLVELGDAIVSTFANYPGRVFAGPLASIEQLRQMTERWGRMQGAAKLRAAVGRIRIGVESPKESQLRCLIVAAGFPEPLVNVTVRDQHGAAVARGDLVYERERVIVEFDGAPHRDAGRFSADLSRNETLADLRWRTLHASEADLRRPADFLGRLARALERGRG